ncbi:AraC family transcriptional regulator [Paenibacillus marinisediminis]
MTWFERMNKALDYIEDNLCADIDMTQAARIACCSNSNFQRVFSIVADVSISEYIRRRKMTLAAFELQNSNIKIVDLALKYGYDSPEAFTRAFNNIHGTTPSSARDNGVVLTAYPRISFLLTVRGAVPMNYRIESKEAFIVYGVESIMTADNGENFRSIPKLWQEAHSDGRIDKLIKSTNMLTEAPNNLCLVNAICDYRSVEGDNTFPYMLFAYKTSKSQAEGYKEVTVPAATWAIFRTENHIVEGTSNAIQSLIKRVYTEWLPTADYEKIDGYELELYYGCGSICWSEIWLRVKPKK